MILFPTRSHSDVQGLGLQHTFFWAHSVTHTCKKKIPILLLPVSCCFPYPGNDLPFPHVPHLLLLQGLNSLQLSPRMVTVAPLIKCLWQPGAVSVEHFICAPVKISELWWSFLQNPHSNSGYYSSYVHMLLVSRDISSLAIYYSLQETVLIFSYLSTHIWLECVMMK